MERLKRLWKTAENNEKAVNIGLAVIVVLGLFFLYTRYTVFIYSTNDDLFMKGILSGEMTGTPEYKGIFLGILTGLLVSSLYKVLPTVPWYGLFLCSCLLLAMIAVLYRCLQTAGKKKKPVVVLLFSLLASGVLLQHFASIQFTVVAGVVGGAAVFWFYTTDDSVSAAAFLKANIPAFLFLILAFSIRDMAVFMLIPIAGMLWLAKWLSGEKPFGKEKRKAYLGFFAIVVLLLGALALLERAAYAGEEWQDYERYNNSRVQIYDYYGYPDYEQNRDTYESLGISFESYVAAATRYSVLLDEKINADSMEVLAALAEKERTGRISVWEKIGTACREFVNRNLNYVDRPLNLFVYAAYLTVGLLALLAKKHKALLSEAALLFGRMAAWGYLFYEGRYPARVTHALYLAEFLALLAIALKHRLFAVKKKVFLWLFAAGFVFLTVWSGFRKAAAVRGENIGRLYTSSAYEQWKEYCVSHPDSFYFMDMESVGHYTEDILAEQEYSCLNFAAMGGWLPKSPIYQKKLERYGITEPGKAFVGTENVYVVFVDSPSLPADYLYDYCEEKYPGCSFETADTFKADNGTVFLIIKAAGEE